MMKNIKSINFTLLLLVITLFSCTKIDPPYITYKGGNTGTGRKVLLEDYTGHKCTNCPEASIAAKTLEDLYDGSVIVLAVHAGIFARPSSTGDYTLDLRNETAEAWYNGFGITSNPMGMVDRRPFGGKMLLGTDQWSNAIDAIIKYSPDAEIKISNVFSDSSRNLNSTISSRFLSVLAKSYTLTVCIMEDSIIGTQSNNNPNVGPTPDWHDYIFMDVLRQSINGNYGESLTSKVDTSKTYVKSYSLKLNDAWKPENCWVLAFISDAATKEVIQVEKAKVRQ